MSTKKMDPRARRSRRMLRDAMIELLTEREYETISVSDITERADLNRATFYLHYTDKQDLFQESINDVLSEIAERFQNITLETNLLDDSNVELLLLNMFEFIAQNANFYKVMLSKGDVQFTNQWQDLFREKLKRRVSSQQPKTKITDDPILIDLLLIFTSSACTGAIKWWLENDMKFTPQYLSKVFSRLVTFGYKGFQPNELGKGNL
ncbi:TetR/AcrR family transcriptional regulator [Paenibacillus piri]|uniref:TetR/AcrR family transcriptional regulator n=1 Tax=Paenibacillus piri TaxID=2547395 RepID=A0A4R5KL36_9BACL|nr:TetR/AcrR family transcriptional regulator [Paenibacillus piri]TDF96283.1 TetR/AcrR family transcriptional regulator [Paenibacillus piri]